MFIRKIAIAIVASIALVGCGGEAQTPQDVANERWESASDQERADICTSMKLFGEEWVTVTFRGLAAESEYNDEEVDAIIAKIVQSCGE